MSYIWTSYSIITERAWPSILVNTLARSLQARVPCSRRSWMRVSHTSKWISPAMLLGVTVRVMSGTTSAAGASRRSPLPISVILWAFFGPHLLC